MRLKVSPPRGYRTLLGIGGVAATMGLVAAGSLGANAAEDTDSTEANVVVESAISLTALTDSFTLTGAPGDIPADPTAVTFTVETNNLAGYTVTVQSTTATLLPQAAGNTDEIPIGALSVTGDTGGGALSAVTPVVVHTQANRSAEGGDALTNGYAVEIPFVNSDTYTTTLTYVAATL
ncbi:hypothetical protein N1027_16495 [Herbiconiux sp. CPCC 205763]|uniref:WxL domain-containing protein n=1 Tax=Herbiconiux aconitum TaxID=2970913 RepID=A0ABT2GXR0_9MICO|nr:hypothetical protein [Herbiconiux aconitum]MCS5719734.1 hypothetical protein [Herbiconiux aconitum]